MIFHITEFSVTLLHDLPFIYLYILSMNQELLAKLKQRQVASGLVNEDQESNTKVKD